ncbi:hypothetical protein [Streptomyces sp. NPDC058291]|uniref:hypothetical protein n=1 Tax=Streptomyces sp. NPDC058291 TaxID=3346427 RepID=UPI0036EA1F72
MKITVCAGVAVVAAALVPTAYASGDGGRDDGGRNGGGSVSVTPSRPSPGSEVTLKVTGCGGRTATAVSAAFVADARLVVAGDGDGALVGDTRVRSTLTAGSYDVRIACADLQVKGRIEVRQPASAPSNGSSAPAAPSALTAPPTPAPAADLADPDAADAADAPDAFDSSSAPPASPTVSDAPLASPVAPVRAGGRRRRSAGLRRGGAGGRPRSRHGAGGRRSGARGRHGGRRRVPRTAPATRGGLTGARP